MTAPSVLIVMERPDSISRILGDHGDGTPRAHAQLHAAGRHAVRRLVRRQLPEGGAGHPSWRSACDTSGGGGTQPSQVRRRAPQRVAATRCGRGSAPPRGLGARYVAPVSTSAQASICRPAARPRRRCRAGRRPRGSAAVAEAVARGVVDARARACRRSASRACPRTPPRRRRAARPAGPGPVGHREGAVAGAPISSAPRSTAWVAIRSSG